MSAFERLLADHLFLVGVFFQANWYNPIFLDRTGLAIQASKTRLHKWKGDPNGFLFEHIDGLYDGMMSMDKYWIKREPKKYWYSDFISTVRSLSTPVTSDLKEFIQIYEVTSTSRVGLRHQAVFDKYDKNSIQNFNSLCFKSAEELAKKYNAKNQSVHLLLESEGLNIALNVSFAIKNDNKMEGPEKGFMVDFDIYREFKTETSRIAEMTIEMKDSLFQYYEKNYLGFLSEVLSTLGISA